MNFKAKIQRTIQAPVSKVWDALTLPDLVRQDFFGTELHTTWIPDTSIYFRGEWEGAPYEDKGIVRRYEPGKVLEYNYLSSWSDLEDRPENYQRIVYRVKPRGDRTVLIIEQYNIDTLEKKLHSIQNWAGLLVGLKKLVEGK